MKKPAASVVARLLVGLSLVFIGMSSGCGSDRQSCNLADRSSCGATAYCVADSDGTGYCEPLKSCDAGDPASCPGGFLCRPSAAGGSVCEPEITAGRIPACLDSAGIDVFAVEANGALSVTWNVNGAIDSAGGFEVAYGTTMDMLTNPTRVNANTRETVLAPLNNGTAYYVVVRALGAGGGVAFTSCQVVATPHVLKFQPDLVVNANTAGSQQNPDIVSNLEGSVIYMAWDDGSRVFFARSTNFGDAWGEIPFPSGSGQTVPSLAIREAITNMGTLVRPAAVFAAWVEGGSVRVARYRVVENAFDAPVTVGPGGAPDIAVTGDLVHVTYSNAAKIYYASSNDDAVSFSTPREMQGSTTMAAAPSVAVDILNGAVYVGWHAILGGGDSNVYLVASQDRGANFGGVVRIDDDTMGLNQTNLSLAVDPRDHEVYATWEDRRGGANVYFSLSSNGGMTWARNIDVGAGLGGDQFNPMAVIDAAGNVYVAFQDTTQGARVVFSRFNAMGSFDPPLVPSTRAGMAGVVADRPSVTTDRYGTVYLAWHENRLGPTNEIVFSRAE
jgi:hypothetical protein